METIFITGATGFIGKNLIDLIQQKKQFNIIAFVEKTDLIGIDYLKKKKIKYLYLDELIEFRESIDVCIHLASYGVAYEARNLDTMIDVNVKLTMKIVEFCKSNGCKLFVNTGSCFEYGHQLETRKIKETDSLKPEDIYAATKVACEDILKVYAKIIGMKFITIRPFSIFGRYESSKRIAPLVFKAGLTNTPIELTGGEQIRDYMYAGDVSDAIYNLILVNNKLIFGDEINICSGQEISLKNFILLISKVCSFDFKLFKFGALTYRKNESMFFCGDNTKLFHYIGRHNYGLKSKDIISSFNYFKDNFNI